jgi:hypothetical protein
LSGAGWTWVHPSASYLHNKYNDELLSPVVLNALTAQGITEAFDWLKEAVALGDIPIGRALEQQAAPGALGVLHEVGAGRRVAPIQVITTSPHLDDPILFWKLPERSQPVAWVPQQQLPDLRYKNPAQAEASGIEDEDAPLAHAAKKRRARKQAKPKAKPKPRPKKRARKASDSSSPIDPPVALPAARAQKRVRKSRGCSPVDPAALPPAAELKEPAAEAVKLSPDDVQLGQFVLCHDEYAIDGVNRAGFTVCKLTGHGNRNKADLNWQYRWYYPTVEPWKRGVVDAKFGGRSVGGVREAARAGCISTRSWPCSRD